MRYRSFCDRTEKKKKYNGSIEHPHDWATLIRQCGKKKPMIVTEMEMDNFFDFSALLKDQLQNKKQNTEGGVLNWRNVKWLHYEKSSPHTLYYKNELNSETFLEVKLSRKGKKSVSRLHLKNAYNESLPISDEKKKDLMDMLPYISSVYQDFYKNIKSRSDIKNIHPDTIDEEEFETDLGDTTEDKSCSQNHKNQSKTKKVKKKTTKKNSN